MISIPSHRPADGRHGGKWWTREDLIFGTARWLGFRRTEQVIRDTLKSVINAAIRHGLLERNRSDHIRKSR